MIKNQKPRLSLKRKNKCHHPYYLNNFTYSNQQPQQNQTFNNFQPKQIASHFQSQFNNNQQIWKRQKDLTNKENNIQYSPSNNMKPSKTIPISKDNQEFKRIIDCNKQFYNDKIKISSKPSHHRFKLPTKTGTTVYKNQFLKKCSSTGSFLRASDYTQPLILNSTYDTNFRCSATFGQSSYKQNYKKPKVFKQEKISLKQVPRSETPRYLQTNYKSQFLNWGAKNVSGDLCLRPTSGRLIGGKFMSKTAYRQDFKGCQGVKTNIQSAMKNSNIFNSVNIYMKCGSTYSNSFELKQNKKMANINCKPMEKYEGDGKMRINNGSQYKRQYLIMKDINNDKKQNLCGRQLSVQQLHQMMLDL